MIRKIEETTYYPITELPTIETNNSLEMILGYLLHGEFLCMSYIEYCNAFEERRKRTQQLANTFFDIE